jgi:sec-independent protein translocase protein TatB
MMPKQHGKFRAQTKMLSIPHMIIIFIVALVVFGPDKLPELARNVGKVMAEFKRATGDFKSTFEDHLRQLEREADQRRISGPTSAAPVMTSTAGSTETPLLQAPGTVPTIPPHLAAGGSADYAPWEEAAGTAADAMSVSPYALEPGANNGEASVNTTEVSSTAPEPSAHAAEASNNSFETSSNSHAASENSAEAYVDINLESSLNPTAHETPHPAAEESSKTTIHDDLPA